MFYDWSFWARADQRPPPGDWVYWLILAGRGAGKTRAGAEAVREWVKDFAIVNLIGATHDDVRDVMVLGDSGLMAICPTGERPRYARASARLDWPNGAVSLLFSAEEPDRLRGKQHMKLWFDELAAWRKPDAFDQALLGLRLGDKPQAVITTTPRPTKLIKQLVADANAIVTRGSTFDNLSNLAEAFLDRITAALRRARASGGRNCSPRSSRRRRARCGRARCSSASVSRPAREPAICRDRRRRRPAGALGRPADECGIIVVGQRADGAIHVLADLTSQGETPGQWGRASSPPIAASRPIASSPRSTMAAKWSSTCCARAIPICRCARSPRRAASILRAEPVAAAYERGDRLPSSACSKRSRTSSAR